MDMQPVTSHSDGVPFSILVKTCSYDGNWVYGTDMAHGDSVAFMHEGCAAEDMFALYQVTFSGVQSSDAWVLHVDPQFPPLPVRKPSATDGRFIHDLCCGVGGFSSAAKTLGLSTVSALDWSDLAASSFQLNHDAPCLVADVMNPKNVHQLHHFQSACGVQPIVTVGIPCQPYSLQGSQQGSKDPRSQVLKGVLQASYMMQSCGLILECVPEALRDAYVQKSIHEYAKIRNCKVVQRVLHLHHVWPSKRSRWFAVILPVDFACELHAFPEIQPPPAVKDLIPFLPWPVWEQHDEDQLKWTPMEKQVYKDPSYGSVDRQVLVTQALPTALHSWGNALYPCPCSCRSQGLSRETLLRKGLRGIEVESGAWPYEPRHIHPKELQLFLGFPALEWTLPDCRAQLCLFGNSVSPIQAIWILAQVQQALGFPTESPHEILGEYLCTLLKQRDAVWPSPLVGTGTCTLDFGDSQVSVHFNTLQQVQHLVRAELDFQLPAGAIQLWTDGLCLPPWAYIQEKTYQVQLLPDVPAAHVGVPVFLEFLGQRSLFFVPAGMSYHSFVSWNGIGTFQTLVSGNGTTLNPKARVQPWTSVVVQQDPDVLQLDLALLEGFGIAPQESSLVFSSTWISTGLWFYDQVVKNNALLTWSGLGFTDLTIWLPSFAEAVIELWPHTMNEQLVSSVKYAQGPIFVITLESWGWNLTRILIEAQSIQVDFFEPFPRVSLVAAHLATRLQSVCEAVSVAEKFVLDAEDYGVVGSLQRVFALLEHALGLPDSIIQTLRLVRGQNEVPTGTEHDDHGAIVSDTLPWTLPCQLPVSVEPTLTSSGHGLNLGFMQAFAQATLAQCHSPSFQVRVLNLDRNPLKLLADTKPGLPLALFVLSNQHWTFVMCTLQEGRLTCAQFDGLSKTPLYRVCPIAVCLKELWKADHASLSSQWKFPQNRQDSCGTVAIAHFVYLCELASFEQASTLEQYHDGFAAVSQTFACAQVGHGGDTSQVHGKLEAILLERGVANSAVKDRVQNAIQKFGLAQLHKVLLTKNPWPGLKQLGNQKASPFQWVTHEELQLHIQERANSKFGVDQKRDKRSKEPRSTQVTVEKLDPSSLVLPSGIFITEDRVALSQLQIAQVQKDARGVAFGTLQDAQPYLTEGKLISPEGLTILIIGRIPDSVGRTLPMFQLRVPAVYRGTGEPILLDVTAIQLGDQQVFLNQNQKAPQIEVFPTTVFRVHIFRDQWNGGEGWQDLIAHPIKSLVQAVPVLNLCRTKDCDQQQCEFFHPSLEEEGIEGGLTDVWSFHWHGLDGTRQPPAKAAVLSIFIRVPESSFNQLHGLSGVNGLYFEPRNKDQPGPDETYAVVWVPNLSHSEVMHRVKTHDLCLAICRLGAKYGVRCLAKSQEELHQALVPHRPFSNCQVTAIYRLEPVPAGTQRTSLVGMLATLGWNAKPLQPIKGTQGQAWNIGAATDPPQPFLETQNGWIRITKVKDQAPPAKAPSVIATSRTKSHIHASSSSSASSSKQDPWWQSTGAADPWGNYFKGSTAAASAPTSQHVQQRFDDVEQRLTSHIQDVLTKEVSQIKGSTDSSMRIDALECQVLSLVEQQNKVTHWVADGNQQMQSIQAEQKQMQQMIQHCHQQTTEHGKVITSVANEIGQVKSEVSSLKDGLGSTLDAYFTKQAQQIESMLAHRH